MHKPITIILMLFLLLPWHTALGGETSTKSKINTTSFNQIYPGTVIANRQARLAFRVGGPLVEVAAKPGDRVLKGQLLMQIDPRDFKDNIQVLEAQLAGAEARRDHASRDYDRAQILFNQHVNATADFDSAKSAFESALAGVQSIKAQLRIARHRLKDTSLLAPYDGVITTQSAENFEMVESGKEVLEIQDISTLEVEIKVSENEIAQRQLQPGQPVTVLFPALQGRSIAATLTEWNVSADPVTRTYELRFSFPAPEEYYVLPGMTVEVRIDNHNHE